MKQTSTIHSVDTELIYAVPKLLFSDIIMRAAHSVAYFDLIKLNLV